MNVTVKDTFQNRTTQLLTNWKVEDIDKEDQILKKFEGAYKGCKKLMR